MPDKENFALTQKMFTWNMAWNFFSLYFSFINPLRMTSGDGAYNLESDEQQLWKLHGDNTAVRRTQHVDQRQRRRGSSN
jgi:hypothetical protein